MNKKRAMAILLVSVLVLAGCGSKKESELSAEDAAKVLAALTGNSEANPEEDMGAESDEEESAAEDMQAGAGDEMDADLAAGTDVGGTVYYPKSDKWDETELKYRPRQIGDVFLYTLEPMSEVCRELQNSKMDLEFSFSGSDDRVSELDTDFMVDATSDDDINVYYNDVCIMSILYVNTSYDSKPLSDCVLWEIESEGNWGGTSDDRKDTVTEYIADGRSNLDAGNMTYEDALHFGEIVYPGVTGIRTEGSGADQRIADESRETYDTIVEQGNGFYYINVEEGHIVDTIKIYPGDVLGTDFEKFNIDIPGMVAMNAPCYVIEADKNFGKVLRMYAIDDTQLIDGEGP